MTSYFSFRWHQGRRRASRRVHEIRLWLSNYINRHIYGAWSKLGLMRWQFAAWIIIAIIGYAGVWNGFARQNQFFQIEQPTSGGVYREGLIGRVRLVNPLFVDNTATADVTELVYSKLIHTKDGETITGDLAEAWSVSTDKRTITLKIRPNIHWHDGVDFTAQDVKFTFKLIQNPDTRSPLASNWDKVVVNALDDATVQFVLPASYSGFFTALSQVGIVPEHALRDINPNLLRLDEFNQRPIGTGPFILDRLDITSDQIKLRKYDAYHFGEPKLDRLEFTQFDDSRALVDSYAKRKIDGLARVEAAQSAQVGEFENLTLKTYRLPSYVGAFFNTRKPELSDKAIRTALAQAIDRPLLVAEELSGEASVVHYPIPNGYSGFNNAARRISYNADVAHTVLEGKFKDPLRLVTVNAAEFPAVAKRLADAWRAAGVPIEVVSVDSYSLQQNYIRPRQYDILLYGQDIGADSDVFGFWHSSQADDPGLNLSTYSSKAADQLLEQARFGKDPAFRENKYKEFVRTWADDVPAVLLYSPYYLYAYPDDLRGVTNESLITPSDRFKDIQNWSLKTQIVTKKKAR
ncbi:hypothetical protein KBC99_00415 [Candidatus Saccharibacteria bacterium]|nr:hypothetical protein [Candidatus Saccharibacteria bacterium]